jgi:hypothetical protein
MAKLAIPTEHQEQVMLCKWLDCGSPVFCKGLCRKHHHVEWRASNAALPRDVAEERFWRGATVHGSGCWLWRRSKSYGHVFFQGRQWRAHRLSWFLTHGEIPPGLVVCHACDNPPCINPGHLFLGTIADNAADRDKKGRNVNYRGEAHGRAKLTGADVKVIREELRQGSTKTGLARRYGVGETTIWHIANRTSWAHVP